MQLRWSDNRMSVEEVVSALRTGEFHEGMKVPLGRLPRSWVEDDGVAILRDGAHVVLLYMETGGALFAACTIERAPTWSETWHFCDTDLFKAHIERSMRSYPRPMLELEEAGTDAKQKNGPVLVVWSDGVMAMSAAFPRFSPEFRLGRVDGEALGADLQRFMEHIPSPMPTIPDEEKVRMTVWTAGESTKTGQAMTLTQHILPMCFVDKDCPDRLGADVTTAWEQVNQSLEGEAEDELTDSAKQRAKNYWTDHKPKPG